MRQVGLSDLDMAARVLLTRPRGDWRAVVAGLIEQAHTADIWRKRTGRAHPNGGTGSLYAQAALWPRGASSVCDPPYCAALSAVLDGLAAWRARMDQDL